MERRRCHAQNAEVVQVLRSCVMCTQAARIALRRTSWASSRPAFRRALPPRLSRRTIGSLYGPTDAGICINIILYVLINRYYAPLYKRVQGMVRKDVQGLVQGPLYTLIGYYPVSIQYSLEVFNTSCSARA